MDDQTPIIVSDLDEVARIHSDPKYILWPISFKDGHYIFSPWPASPNLTNVASEKFHVDTMPPSNDNELRVAKEKLVNNEPLTFRESIIVGRDHIVKKLGDYELQPDHVYRVIDKKALEAYEQTGFVIGSSDKIEHKEYKQDGKIVRIDKPIDWYLGGLSFRYGNIILECPADREYFFPSPDHGSGLAIDGKVRHMYSSGYANPVPMDMVRVIHYDRSKDQIIQYNEEKSEKTI